MTDFTTELRAAAEAASLSLSEEQILKFTRYDALLVDWNERMNLTAITEPRDVAVKHMVDSLTAYDAALFSGAPTVIDVGTGAGFPGIPLKIFNPSIRLTLMDSLAKRLAFLEAVVEDLGLTGVTCVHARAEDAAHEPQRRERYDIAPAFMRAPRTPRMSRSAASATTSPSAAPSPACPCSSSTRCPSSRRGATSSHSKAAQPKKKRQTPSVRSSSSAAASKRSVPSRSPAFPTSAPS